MKYVLMLTILVLAGFMISCSDNPADVKPDDIQIEVIETALKVLNGGERAIYYFAIDRESSAYVLWAPRSEEDNKIPANSLKEIRFENIYGFEKGKQIIFNYWVTKEPKSEDIRKILVETE